MALWPLEFANKNEAFNRLRHRLLDGWIILTGEDECVRRLIGLSGMDAIVLVIEDGGEWYRIVLARKNDGLGRLFNISIGNLLWIDASGNPDSCSLQMLFANEVDEDNIGRLVSVLESLMGA